MAPAFFFLDEHVGDAEHLGELYRSVTLQLQPRWAADETVTLNLSLCFGFHTANMMSCL